MSSRLTRGRKRQIEERLEEFNIGIPIDEFGCELPYDEPKAKNSKNNKKKDDRLGWDGNVVVEIKKTPTDNKKDKRKRCHESSPESSPTYYRKITTKVTVHHHTRPSSPEPETKRSKVFPLKDIDEMVDDIVIEKTIEIPIEVGIEAVEQELPEKNVIEKSGIETVEQKLLEENVIEKSGIETVEKGLPEKSVIEKCPTPKNDTFKAKNDLEIKWPGLSNNCTIDLDSTADSTSNIDVLVKTNIEVPITTEPNQEPQTPEKDPKPEPEKITNTPISSKTTILNFDEIQLLSSEIIAECEAA